MQLFQIPPGWYRMVLNILLVAENFKPGVMANQGCMANILFFRGTTNLSSAGELEVWILEFMV
jgi:hypothetical protein